MGKGWAQFCLIVYVGRLIDYIGHPFAFFCDSGTSTHETYYSNFIARPLYTQKCLKYIKCQYWPPVPYLILAHRGSYVQ